MSDVSPNNKTNLKDRFWQTKDVFDSPNRIKIDSERLGWLRCTYVMCIDVDRMYDFNNMWGHQQGDVLLQNLWHIITAKLPEDAYAARCGGEQFVVLVPWGSDQVIEYCRYIKDAFKLSKANINGGTTVSIAYGIRDISENPIDIYYLVTMGATQEARLRGRNVVLQLTDIKEGWGYFDEVRV